MHIRIIKRDCSVLCLCFRILGVFPCQYAGLERFSTVDNSLVVEDDRFVRGVEFPIASSALCTTMKAIVLVSQKEYTDNQRPG